MAQDGSMEVEWKGQAFPYLLNYQQVDKTATPTVTQQKSDRLAAIGTWNGPAPVGSAVDSTPGRQQHQQDKFIRLGGDVVMPKLGQIVKYSQQTTPDITSDMIILVDPDIDTATKLQIQPEVFLCVQFTNVVSNIAQNIKELSQLLNGRDKIDLLIVNQNQFENVSKEYEGSLGVQVDNFGELECLMNKNLGQKPLVCLTNLNPLQPQRKLVGYCIRKGISVIACQPYGPSKQLLHNEVVVQTSKEIGKPVSEVLCQWAFGRGVAIADDNLDIKHNIFQWELPPACKVVLDTLG